MEIPGIDTNRLVALINTAEGDPVVSAIAIQFEGINIQLFLGPIQDPLLIRLDRELRNYMSGKINTGIIGSNEWMDDVAAMAAVPFAYLQKAIENESVIDLIIMLVLQVYLPFNLKIWSALSQLDTEKKTGLFNNILKLLSNVGFSVSTPKDAPYSEKKLLRDFRKAKLKKNIPTVYRFITALERGGKQFYLMPILRNIVAFLEAHDSEILLALLQLQREPEAVAYFLTSVNEETLSDLLTKNNQPNLWLIFELIRSLEKLTQKDAPEEKNIDAIVHGITLINSIDSVFLQQTLIFFDKSLLFNAALGRFLTDLSIQETKQIIVNTIQIDQYHRDSHIKGRLLNEYEKKASSENFKELISLVKQLWETFIETKWQTIDFFANDLVITNQADFVAAYYEYFHTEDEIIVLIEGLSNKLRFIDGEWFISASRQITRFHLYFSRLFILSFIAARQNIATAKLQNALRLLSEIKTFKSNYLNHSNSNSMEIVLKNLNNKHLPQTPAL